MTPYQSWQKNKGRVDLRKYTREFQKRFKEKKKTSIEPGKVYAISYLPDSRFPTDKHHLTPLILCLGKFRDTDGQIYVRGINLFFLDTRKVLEVLQDAFMFSHLKPDSRVLPTVRLHDKFMHVFPWAFKNFDVKRIRVVTEVEISEWGMIPLLYKYLIGNFNSTGLNEDFQKENKLVRKKPFVGKKDIPTENDLEKEDVLEADLVDLSVNDDIYMEDDI